MTENQIIHSDAHQICDRIDVQTLHNATILVTGASGLIGSYILACLAHWLNRGIRMRVYAHIYSEPPPHVRQLVSMSGGGIEFLRLNLADFSDYQRLPEADLICHSGGYAQPARFMADPIATLKINTCATIALLNRLRRGGKFLFVSSTEVYSGLNKFQLTESDIGRTTPLHPRAAYIEGKRTGEAICYAIRSQQVQATAARLAHIYGPGTRAHDRRVLNSFVESALCRNIIELLDDGTVVRTYCYIADAVEMLWHVWLHGTDPVYNVGGKSICTITELAQMIGCMTGVKVVFPLTPTNLGGAPSDVRLDLTKITTEFRKTHFVTMEDGLRATIDWQRGLYR